MQRPASSQSKKTSSSSALGANPLKNTLPTLALALSTLVLPAIFFSASLTPTSASASTTTLDSASHPTKLPKKARAKRVQDSVPMLTEEERNSLRFKLENAWNEVDLLVKNAQTDLKDVQRQERDFKDLQVYQKFPVAKGADAQFAGLKDRIKKSVERFGMRLVDAKLIETSKPDQPIPTALPPNAQEFHFTDDQLAQRTRMDLVVVGKKQQLQDWMNTWATVPEPSETPDPKLAVTPFMEWDPAALTTLPEPTNDPKYGASGPDQSAYKIHAQAYEYRNISYPKLQPQNPMELLPSWARQNPSLFKAQEPLLWGLVEKTQATIPQALPKYPVKAQFALNAARMTYFTKKVTNFE